MDELGHILREARENKGLTLAQVQSEIRINPKFLDALETGEYHRLPTPVHVRGFLRNYARFLGLDPQPLLDRYEIRLKEKPAPPPPEIRREDPSLSTAPIQHGPTFFDPVNFEVNAGNQSSSSDSSAVRLIIIAALLIAVALVFNRFLPLLTSGEDGSEALTQSITAFLQGQTEAGPVLDEVDPDELILQPEMATGGLPITGTSRNPGMAPSSLDPADTLPPSPTRPALPATMETIELRLEITERGWMEVTIDGDVVFTGIVRDTDPAYEFTAQEEAIVNTGNAIGVFVYINDIAWGRMGERGESREEIWRTTQ
jgi:cytoskeleton protein RodZ